jgi:hypothetical protein
MGASNVPLKAAGQIAENRAIKICKICTFLRGLQFVVRWRTVGGLTFW